VKERKDIKMTIPMFTGNLEQSYSEIRELLSGNTADIVSQALLLENNLGKIALYWSKGGNIAWKVLHEGKRARRIPLPTYPFEKRHCWIDCGSDSRAIKESHKLVDNSKAFVENIDSSVGPLVAEIVSELLGMSLTEMKLDISLEEYGVDSLYILALLQQLQDRVNPAVNLDNLKECRTIQDIINMLVELNGNK
jgi:acyl carrier protein